MKRTTGAYAISTTLGESLQAFMPHPLPPAEPTLAPESYADRYSTRPFSFINFGPIPSLRQRSRVASLMLQRTASCF